MTAFNSKTGGFHLTTVGRVQTPTLAILVEREEKIKKFVSRDYWEIHGTFAAAGGRIPRALVRREVCQEGRRRPTSSRSAFGTPSSRKRSAHKCLGKPGIVTEESKPTTSAVAAALRFDELAARGERAVRFLRQEHARPGAGALREAQGADLSANGFARVAGGLPRHGEDRRWACWRTRNYGTFRRTRF